MCVCVCSLLFGVVLVVGLVCLLDCLLLIVVWVQTSQAGDPPQSTLLLQDDQCQQEIIYAVQRGRIMVKEMIGVIQLKKYRTMKQRYVSTSITVTNDEDDRDRNLPQCEEMNVTAVESSIEEKETAKREL